MPQQTMTAAELSDAAAEAIRQLNHLTRPAGNGLEYPGDAYSTVSNLKTLVQRLPQTFEQIFAFLADLHEGGNLRSDRGPNADDDVAAVKAALDWAADDARNLAETLDSAHSALSPISYAA
ncbi:hypothetical protein HUT19_11545 [Streptomyces sp. NA02950]|uniref:hypothetical protein n=1 Tax=Streptomyces sp. NA02950 TaxID=2742137 RepID=UPI0015928101|nr:hypothetical protein [Streptomyces sp. NA02950]QKV92304.1 hypothetical protein HUT19_11545 [Streptomyces sp. NA02950]